MNLTSPTTSVDGIGPKRAEALEETHGAQTVEDLLRLYPRKYVDRSEPKAIEDLEEGEDQSVRARVVKTPIVGSGSSKRLQATLKDSNGDAMTAVWFGGYKGVRYALQSIQGEAVFVGEPSEFGSKMSMSHPEFYEPSDTMVHTGRIVPTYPSGQAVEGAGLTEKKMRSVMHEFVTTRLQELDVPSVPIGLRQKFGLIGGRRARRAIHFPKNEKELKEARRRIQFDEFLSLQLFMQQLYQRREKGPELQGLSDGLENQFLEGLPFELTGAQKSALADVREDVSGGGGRMKRLVQGDVGSGKTVVAVAAMMRAVGNGHQSAFLAPTTVLAEQHYETVSGYAEGLPVEVALLVGSMANQEQKAVKEALSDGRIDIVVGTHALLQGDVGFDSLALGVIDEQQRFGVRQRQELFEAQSGTHMLLTSATPIPRSLAMGFYGDLDMSVIGEMPPGRKPVDTYWNTARQRSDVYDFLENEVARDHDIFVVYPRVDEDPESDLKSVKAGADRLQQRFPEAGAQIVHGAMPDEEKTRAMRRFSEGEVQILVATTVIEVGVDVESATAIVVEDADQLGLSQLHQLRGRVGRSDIQSFCVLMTEGQISDTARERLSVMTRTNDGFEIAEADLQLRGAGNMLSTRQSGVPDMKIADPSAGGEAMERAQEAAQSIVQKDPELEEHLTLKGLLQRRLSGANRKLARVG